jgi:hypothetical protein
MSRHWKLPPPIKVYEALGSIADSRVTLHDGGASVGSSSGNKVYEVTYDRVSKEIGANDNASYWRGYLGYPAIAYLLMTGTIPYDQHVAVSLRGIPWKDVNTKFKNDYEKTLGYVEEHIAKAQGDASAVRNQVGSIMAQLAALPLKRGQSRPKPPAGY